MALADDIAAIRNNDALSEDEKRAQIYAVKINGILAKIGSFVGNSYTLDGVTYTLLAIQSSTQNGVLLLGLTVRRVQGGVERVDTNYLVNPPLIDAATGKHVDAMNNQEALAFARTLVATFPPMSAP